MTLRDLRDRALIATLTYSFARISAALKMKVEDLRPRGAGWSCAAIAAACLADEAAASHCTSGPEITPC